MSRTQTQTQHKLITVLFPEKLAGGEPIGSVEGRQWLCTVHANEQGGWTAELLDKFRADDVDFVPMRSQPRAEKGLRTF